MARPAQAPKDPKSGAGPHKNRPVKPAAPLVETRALSGPGGWNRQPQPNVRMAGMVSHDPIVGSPLEVRGNESLPTFALRCQAEGSPGIWRLHVHVDDRGWSLMGLLSGEILNRGQINVSAQLPGVIKAWHAHRKQTDFWCVIDGTLKAAMMTADGSRRWLAILGERNPAVLIIPPSLWHGAATVGSKEARLLYYVDREYRAASPDEQRMRCDQIWNPWPCSNH